jgi:hypothetical protein
MKPVLEALGTTRILSKIRCDDPLSKFCFNSNLRRYKLLFALTSGVKEYDHWMNDNECWEPGRGLLPFPFPLNSSAF